MELTRFDRYYFSGTVVLQAFRTCMVALVADVSLSLRSHTFTLMVVLLSFWTQRTSFHGLTEKSRTVVLRGTYMSWTISMARGSESIVILGISLRFRNLGCSGG